MIKAKSIYVDRSADCTGTFALSAVYLVEGAFVASRTIRFMKDARELGRIYSGFAVRFFRKKIMKNFLKAEINHRMGDVQWETEVEMTSVTDLYKVSLTLAYDGNEELGVEAGERIYHMLMLRPTWARHSDLVQTARDFGRKGKNSLPNLKQAQEN